MAMLIFTTIEEIIIKIKDILELGVHILLNEMATLSTPLPDIKTTFVAYYIAP